ncbi:hypothetical protein L9F63_002221, partial [Diploptera punctata]
VFTTVLSIWIFSVRGRFMYATSILTQLFPYWHFTSGFFYDLYIGEYPEREN